MNRVLWVKCRLCGLNLGQLTHNKKEKVKMKRDFAREHKSQWFKHFEFAGMR